MWASAPRAAWEGDGSGWAMKAVHCCAPLPHTGNVKCGKWELKRTIRNDRSMWVFCNQAKITPVMLFLLLSVKACHSYLERHSWKWEGRRQGERSGGGKGEREEEGMEGEEREGGRKFKQTINGMKCVSIKNKTVRE